MSTGQPQLQALTSVVRAEDTDTTLTAWADRIARGYPRRVPERGVLVDADGLVVAETAQVGGAWVITTDGRLVEDDDAGRELSALPLRHVTARACLSWR